MANLNIKQPQSSCGHGMMASIPQRQETPLLPWEHSVDDVFPVYFLGHPYNCEYHEEPGLSPKSSQERENYDPFLHICGFSPFLFVQRFP